MNFSWSHGDITKTHLIHIFLVKDSDEEFFENEENHDEEIQSGKGSDTDVSKVFIKGSSLTVLHDKRLLLTLLTPGGGGVSIRLLKCFHP